MRGEKPQKIQQLGQGQKTASLPRHNLHSVTTSTQSWITSSRRVYTSPYPLTLASTCLKITAASFQVVAAHTWF